MKTRQSELEELLDRWHSFSELERANAEIAFLKDKIRKISKLTRSRIDEDLHPDVRELKLRFFKLIDMNFMNLVEASDWIEQKRKNEKFSFVWNEWKEKEVV